VAGRYLLIPRRGIAILEYRESPIKIEQIEMQLPIRTNSGEALFKLKIEGETRPLSILRSLIRRQLPEYGEGMHSLSFTAYDEGVEGEGCADLTLGPKGAVYETANPYFEIGRGFVAKSTWTTYNIRLKGNDKKVGKEFLPMRKFQEAFEAIFPEERSEEDALELWDFDLMVNMVGKSCDVRITYSEDRTIKLYTPYKKSDRKPKKDKSADRTLFCCLTDGLFEIKSLRKSKEKTLEELTQETSQQKTPKDEDKEEK